MHHIRFASAVLASLLMMTLNNSILAQWAQTNGPGSTPVKLVVQGTNLIAGTASGGAFLSTLADGNDWTSVSSGLAYSNVTALGVYGSNVFAGTYPDGVYRSTNGGTTWNSLGNGAPETYVNAFAVQDTFIFAGTFLLGAYRSSDDGDSWTSVNTGLQTFPTVQCFTLKGNMLFLGTSDSGVYRSTNYGANWTPANSGLLNRNVYALCNLDTVILAGMPAGAIDVSGVFRSTNNGSSWAHTGTGLPSTAVVRAFAISGTTIYAGLDNAGVYLSTDLGTTWTLYDSGLPFGTPIRDLAIRGSSIYAASTNGWVYFHSDIPMPVELVSFSVSAREKNVELRWQTATEVNNYGFEVERKTIDNGKLTIENWKQVGFVEGNGTTNVPNSYSFVDMNANGRISYRLKQIDRDGNFAYSSEVEIEAGAGPDKFRLDQNYPNPFNPATTIGFTVPALSPNPSPNGSGEGVRVTLKVYDVTGKEVATLVNEAKEAGSYEVKFDASKTAGGVYFYRLASGNFVQTKKMVLLK